MRTNSFDMCCLTVCMSLCRVVGDGDRKEMTEIRFLFSSTPQVVCVFVCVFYLLLYVRSFRFASATLGRVWLCLGFGMLGYHFHI
jgi:hypothetical protein